MTRDETISLAALATVLVSLLLVGVGSGTILRHLVQCLPVLGGVVAVALRRRWSRWAAVPVFLFWLFIMSLIWLYLLGLSNVVAGHFSPAEIVLTVVIGSACVAGLVVTVRPTSWPGGWAGPIAFVLCAALQIGAMWLSLRPALQ